MQITYEYKIIEVDEESRTMLVEYTSPEREDVLASMPIPFEGQELEAVIKEYSPVALWVEVEKTLSAPSVGATGVITEEQSDVGRSEVVL